MHRVSLKAIIILVTVVSIYLYFFPPIKKNKFGGELRKNFDPVFGTWKLTHDSTDLVLLLNTDTTYKLTKINFISKDTIYDEGKFLVKEFGVRDNSGFGYLTLLSNSNTTATYQMDIYKMEQLELTEKKTKLLTRFEKQ